MRKFQNRIGWIVLGIVSGSCVSATMAETPPSPSTRWGHWRGDDGNGISHSAHPPVAWSSTENVKWKIPIPGRGSGTPAVWDDRVFVTSAVRTDDKTSDQPQITELAFKLFCLDRQTGKTQWEATACIATPHEPTHGTNGYASASPCTDGERVYAHFGSRGLYCYTMEGQLVWKRDDLGQMRTRNAFGEGSSPTLVDDWILVPWDHEGPSYLAALDKRTGKTVWKTDRDEPTCWATPLVVVANGKKQIVMNGQNAARAYDLQTGRELWRCGGQTQRPVASPVAGNGLVFVGSGFRGAFLGAFRLDGKDDIEGTDSVVWTIHRDTPDIASLLLSDSRLYFYKAKTGILSCVDAASGKPHFETQRIRGLNSIYASPIAAGGHVYLTGRSGTTVVINDANSLEIVATNSVGETVDATPVPVGDELLIRGARHLFCIGKAPS